MTEPVRPGKRGPRQRRSALDGVPPQYREMIAKWVEGKVAEFPRLIALSKTYQRSHPDDAGERSQCQYWTNALAFARFLAYWLRTETVRAVEDRTNPERKINGPEGQEGAAGGPA